MEQQSKIARIVGRYNLKTEVALLNKRKSMSDETKYEHVIANSDEDLGKYIINNNIDTWEQVENLAKKTENNPDEIVKLCARQRLPKEEITEYAQVMKKELAAQGVSEQAIVKILAVNTWPGRTGIAVDLSRNTSVDEFLMHANQIADRIATSNKKRKYRVNQFCEKCKISGHLTERCLKKNNSN